LTLSPTPPDIPGYLPARLRHRFRTTTKPVSVFPWSPSSPCITPRPRRLHRPRPTTERAGRIRGRRGRATNQKSRDDFSLGLRLLHLFSRRLLADQVHADGVPRRYQDRSFVLVPIGGHGYEINGIRIQRLVSILFLRTWQVTARAARKETSLAAMTGGRKALSRGRIFMKNGTYWSVADAPCFPFCHNIVTLRSRS
jgi:hypothetical protein